MKCFICRKPSHGSMVFETGNNAEYQVEPLMCENHLDEAEKTGYDFEEKYADQILEELHEDWREKADSLRNICKEGEPQ